MTTIMTGQKILVRLKNSRPARTNLERSISIPWSQRLSFNIIFFSFRNLRREALIEAPSREEKKASGRDRWESHFHAGSALDSCQRCHFLLTNHKGGSDLQFVDMAGWVSSPVLRNKLLRRERRGAFAVFTSCQTSRVLFSFLKGTNYFFGT